MSRHSAAGHAWRTQRKRVLDRDGWACTACGKDLHGSDATVDHVEAIALNPGRTYLDHELVAMCRRCNSRKGARTMVRLDYRNPRWFRSAG